MFFKNNLILSKEKNLINMAKIELENKILEFPIEEIKSDPIFLIKSFSELTNVLNNIKK